MASTISRAPATTRATACQLPDPNTIRTGSMRPVESTHRSRCASSACRHSRAMPTVAISSGQNTAPAPRKPCTISRRPKPSAPSAIAGPASTRRRTRRGRAPRRLALSRPGALSANCSSVGSTIQRPAYIATPAPPSAAATTNAARTHSTGRLRCAARPAATPPMTRSWVSRVARRNVYGGPPGRSGRPAAGASRVGVLLIVRPSSQMHRRRTMRRDPDPTLIGGSQGPDQGRPRWCGAPTTRRVEDMTSTPSSATPPVGPDAPADQTPPPPTSRRPPTSSPPRTPAPASPPSRSATSAASAASPPTARSPASRAASPGTSTSTRSSCAWRSWCCPSSAAPASSCTPPAGSSSRRTVR